MTNTATPGFRRPISPGPLASTGTSGATMYSDSVPLNVTCSTGPCGAWSTFPTVALVMMLSGIRSHGYWPSPVPRGLRLELPVARKRAILAALIERIEVKVDQVDIHLRPLRLCALLDLPATPSQGVNDDEIELLSVPVRLRRS